MLLFLPIRAQIRLHKLPVATLLVVLACLAIYLAQYQNEARIGRAADHHCSQGLVASEKALWRSLGHGEAAAACRQLLVLLHAGNRSERMFADIETSLVQELKNRTEAARLVADLRASYARFAAHAPGYLSARLWQERPSWNVWRWVSSSFAHGSWSHVIFNLLFFFAFAATVELLIGPVLFIVSILFLSLGIGLTDTLVHLGQPPVPSLGLSGVVTGMLAMFIYFVPRARIRFFFWFLLSFGFIAVPGWLVGLWYIGGDLLRVLGQEHSQVNYIAHLAGAAFGFLLGVTLFRRKRHWSQALVEHKDELTQEESGWRKFNGIVAAPGVFAMIFITFSLVVVLFAKFVSLFWLQLLLAAPILAAIFQFARWRRASRPEAVRVREASARQARGDYEKGRGDLEKLAATGNARAMVELGDIHERGLGVVKDLAQAVYWYELAAQRNNPEAQYRLGRMSLEGRGLRKDETKILDWWQRAVAGGHPAAAMSLAHRCENTAGAREAREQAKDEAVNWYYQAGRLYLRQGRREDAHMALTAMRGLRPGHPLAEQLAIAIGPAAGLVPEDAK